MTPVSMQIVLKMNLKADKLTFGNVYDYSVNSSVDVENTWQPVDKEMHHVTSYSFERVHFCST